MQVEFRNVTKRYGSSKAAVHAVQNLNLTIESGALHFLLGPSGCGKTTTLRMLAGLEPVSEGQILFDGKDVTKLPAAERGIGMVFQNYALWPHMTVRRNVEYGLKLRKLNKADMEERVQDVLKFTQLAKYSDRLPGQLSGGQQQRVALARALAIRPNVLLLDEPLSNLDAKLRLEMRDNISRIHRKTGITTVYVTHDQKEALSMGTSISVMHGGKLIQTGSPRTLYQQPRSPFIAGFVGETNLVEGTCLGTSQDSIDVETALGAMRARRQVGPFKKGDPVVLSIRPEAIRLAHPNQPSRENILNMELVHLTYLGEVEQLNLKLNSIPIKANLFYSGGDHLTDGQRLQVYVDPVDVLALSPDGDIGPGT